MAETAVLTPIEIGLTAAIVGVGASEPPQSRMATTSSDVHAGLPFGPLDPLAHRTFEIGLRAWVEQQTGLRVGYVEQLYTFGDRGRHAGPADEAHMVSVGYLALTGIPSATALKAGARVSSRGIAFSQGRTGARSGPRSSTTSSCSTGGPARRMASSAAPSAGANGCGFASGRRIAVGRREGARPLRDALRSRTDRGGAARWARIRARARLAARARRADALRPPPHPGHRDRAAARQAEIPAGGVRADAAEFTLTELQHTVEAISGRVLHKQNFRRLVEGTALVEPTGETSTATGGRPAALFRFRREVLAERPAPGPAARADALEHCSFLN